MTPPLKSGEADAGSTAGSPDNAIPAVPASEGSLAQDSAETTQKGPLSSRFHPPPAHSNKPKFIAVIAIIVILAIVGGAFIYSTILQGNTGEPSVPLVTPAITPASTIIPTPTVPQTPVPQIILVPTPQPTVRMPDKGVWVKVQYTGNFTGRVGTSGDLKQVNESGDQYYQIPITEGIVEVSIQKEDGSGNVLAVEVYQNGKMVIRSTKATPFGAIDIRVDLMRG
jgi:hypothetical protein